jgi:hypothetical protein
MPHCSTNWTKYCTNCCSYFFPVDGSDTESRALIAGVAIENVKTLGRVASGEIGIADGLKEMQKMT